MGKYFLISLVAGFIFSGCSTMEKVNPIKPNVVQEKDTASHLIKAFSNYEDEKEIVEIPSMSLPNPYKKVDMLGDQEISLNADGVPLSAILFTISQTSGLNLIINKDVDKSTPVTISVKKANLKTVLDIIMNISGTYYELNGNILHVKGFMRKLYKVPYVNTSTNLNTELGGDTLGSASGEGSNGGLKGDVKLKFGTPEENVDFYSILEKNVKQLMSDGRSPVLNRFTGTLSVYDKKSNIDAIDELINDIKDQSSKQILIETKILEVTLNNGHKLGVNWDSVSNNVRKAGDSLAFSQTLGLGGAVAGSVNYSSSNFNAVIDALDTSGKVDTLSNPRIKVLSGQSAIISSGKLIPYWEKKVDITTGTGSTDTQVSYERRDILDGITMGVTPTVMSDGRIMLNVVPISSSIESEKSYKDGGIVVATAPIVNVKEAGTIIYAKNNDLVLIGGMINNQTKEEDQKVPLLGDIPWLGAFFTKKNHVFEKKELVILIRIRVIK